MFLNYFAILKLKKPNPICRLTRYRVNTPRHSETAASTTNPQSNTFMGAPCV